MPHLTLEELARLVDEAPEPHEAGHLRDCLVCRRELDALRAQTAALGALDDPALPPAGWPALEAALLHEGLMRTRPRGYAGPVGDRPWLRIAAAFALFALGGAAGAGIWGRTHPSTRIATPPAVLSPDAARHAASPSDVAVAPTPPSSAEVVTSTEPPSMASRGDVGFASTREPSRPAPSADPAVRRAEKQLVAAEAAYLVALQRYAAIADPSSGADPATRMAALDRMIATTRQALERAPADPVINAYHLAAVRQREQLRADSPPAGQDWF